LRLQLPGDTTPRHHTASLQRGNIVNDYPAPALYIDGRWLDTGSAGSRPVVNPADESVLGTLPLAGDAELDLAVAAARRGFEAWRKVPAHARWETITRATRLLRERADAIARVMTLEQGKPLAESRREVLLSADIIDFLAEEGKRAYGRLVPPRSDAVLAQAVTRVPVGPAALFTPWNFPMNLPARKVGAALAAGCSAILKPAEETPGSAIALVRAFHDAGLTPGVLNLVCGDPALVSAHLIGSDGIRKVSFTGSIPVGKHLGELCARGVKRFTAELGGHAPVLVLGDADAARVARLSVAAKYRNAGQVCASPTRFLVHQSLFKAFVDAFAAGARQLRIGSGLESETGMGPLIHARRIGAMEALVEDALACGATLACGGRRLNIPATSSSRPCSSMFQTAPASCARSRSGRSPSSMPGKTSMPQSHRRTDCPTACRPTCSRATWRWPTRSRRAWRPAWSASTTTACRSRKRRSAASRRAATARRAGRRVWRPTSTPS